MLSLLTLLSSRRFGGWMFHILSPALIFLVLLQPAWITGYRYDYEGRSGSYTDMYGNYQHSPKAYTLPTTNSGKLKVFILCKPDCKNKCEHTIYESRYNTKGECHDCLLQCMSATTSQAKHVGVEFSGSKHRRMMRDDPYSNRRQRRKKKRKQQRAKIQPPSLASASSASSSSSNVNERPSDQSVMKNYFIS